MKHLRSAWFVRVALVVAALALAGPPRQVSAQAPTAPALSPHAAAVKTAEAVAQEVLAHGVPGLALAVAVDGKIVWSDGFGYADLEARVPARPTTKFRIGSVSKPITAAGLMLLVEAGKLDLDAPVQKYVP